MPRALYQWTITNEVTTKVRRPAPAAATGIHRRHSRTINDNRRPDLRRCGYQQGEAPRRGRLARVGAGIVAEIWPWLPR